MDVLEALPRESDNPWVVPGAKPGKRQAHGGHRLDGAEYPHAGQIARRAYPHIRHSFASRALALGEGLPIVGRLLDHRRIETTARYAHLARDSVRESDERIAVSIADDIL